MSHNAAALLGKAFVVWFIVAGITAPLLGRLLARQRVSRELKSLHAREVARQRKLLEVADSVTVDGLFQAVAGELADRNRFAREAATPMSDREWSDARAWLCDDDNQPKRSA